MSEPQTAGTWSRRVVNALLGLGFVATLTGAAGSALAYLRPDAGAGGSDFLAGPAGPLTSADVAQDRGVVGRSRLGKVLVIRRQNELIGLRATCTHLGCTVAWNPTTQQVECPCHGARYNLRGDVVRGPAREALGQVVVTEEAGGLRVRPALEG